MIQRATETLRREMALAARSLRRSPGYAFVAVASLALGLALVASTAAIVNAYLIRGLPYGGDDRLFHVQYAPPGPMEPGNLSQLDWTSIADVVAHPITATSDTFYLFDGGFGQSARALRVNRGFQDGLNIRAVAGRAFTPEDFREGSGVAMIGYALWRDRFGGTPDAIGRSVVATVEGNTPRTETFRIVGVLPPEFYFGRDSDQIVDVMLPLTSPARTYMVRLTSGVSAAIAEQRMTSAARQVATGLTPDWSGVHLESVRARYDAATRPALVGVTAAALVVLAVSALNVGVLMLLRTLRRRKEMALRVALGSGLAHLFRLIAAEAALLTIAAFVIAVTVSWLVARAAAPAIQTALGRPAPNGVSSISVDATVLALAAGAAIVVAIALSLLPLSAPWRTHLASALGRDGMSSADGRTGRRLRSALVIAEVAGTLALVAVCSLTMHAVVRFLNTDLGYDPTRFVRARVILQASKYPGGNFLPFYDRLAARLSETARSPVVFSSWPAFNELPVSKVEAEAGSGRVVSAGGMNVSAGYFDAFRIRILAGREFGAGDIPGAPLTAVVSRALSGQLWPSANAVGRRVRIIQTTPEGERAGPWLQVVGVAADVRRTYDDVTVADIYSSLSQSSPGRFVVPYVAADAGVGTLEPAIRRAVADVDPHAAVAAVMRVSLEDRQLAGARFGSALMTGFSGVAGALVAIGIFGVTAYTVRERRRETAVRLALGADASALTKLFLKEAVAVTGIGLLIGLAASVPATRSAAAMLAGARPLEWAAVLIAVPLVGCTAVLAAWLPARRAARTDPARLL